MLQRGFSYKRAFILLSRFSFTIRASFSRFMDSEIELNDIIQEMHSISTRPDLYPHLFETNFLELLLGLLAHENIGKLNVLFSY